MDKNIITLQKLYKSFGEVEFYDWLDGLNYSQAFMVCAAAGPWKYQRRQKIQTDAIKYIGKNNINLPNDIIDIRHKLDFDWSAKSINCFPLDWQRKITLNLFKWLMEHNMSMEYFCAHLKRKARIQEDLMHFPNYKEDHKYSEEGKKSLSNFANNKRDNALIAAKKLEGVSVINNEIKVLEAREDFYEACGSPNGTKVLSLFCRDKLKINSFPIDRHVKRTLQQHNLPIKEDQMIELCRTANLDPRKVATGMIRGANIDNPNWNKLIGEMNND